MRGGTIGRNYAQALFELGEKHGETEAYRTAFGQLDQVLTEGDGRVRQFLETPKIDDATKQRVLRSALEGRVPERFLRFLQVVIAKGRQRLLHGVREQYDAILDEKSGRVHAQVTLAREPDEATVREIGERLSGMLGKTVVPHVTVNPSLVGGIVVRYGDRVLDGSVRRQLLSLKREMLSAGLPAESAAGA